MKIADPVDQFVFCGDKRRDSALNHQTSILSSKNMSKREKPQKEKKPTQTYQFRLFPTNENA
jgi:hypothetical protein